MKEYTAEDVLRIAEAYAYPDDWNVEAVYVSSLRRIVEGGQDAGYAPDHIVSHARHTGAECRRNDCVIGADEEREREARSSGDEDPRYKLDSGEWGALEG